MAASAGAAVLQGDTLPKIGSEHSCPLHACAPHMQPDDPATATIEAWYMDDSTEDQRLPHRYADQACTAQQPPPHASSACRHPCYSAPVLHLCSSLTCMPFATCRQDPNKPALPAALAELGVLYWKLDADNHETDPRLAAIRKIRNYNYVVRGGKLARGRGLQRRANNQHTTQVCVLLCALLLSSLAWYGPHPMQEIISISKDTLPNYEAKIKTFYEEHIHSDEEIRFILDGSGTSCSRTWRWWNAGAQALYADERFLCWNEALVLNLRTAYAVVGIWHAGYFDVRDLNDQWIRIHCKKGDLIVLPEGIYHRFTLDTGDFTKVRAGQGCSTAAHASFAGRAWRLLEKQDKCA